MSTLYMKGKTVWMDFTDQFGKRHSVSLKIKNHPLKRSSRGKIAFPREALLIRDDIDRKIRAGIFGLPNIVKRNIPTFSEAFSRYHEEDGQDNKLATRANHRVAKEHLIKYLGDLKLPEYTEELMLKYRKWLLEEFHDETASNQLRMINPIFNWADRKGFIPQNPITKAVRIKPSAKRPIAFDDKYFHAVLSGARERGKGALADQLEFLFLSGWRAGESCTVKWNDINWKEGWLLRNDAKTDAYRHYVLSPVLAAFMKKLPQQPKRRGAQYVFRYTTSKTLGVAFRELRELIINDLGPDGKKLNIHSFRKHMAMFLRKKGVEISLVADILGHASIATTRSYYLAADLDEQRAALEKAFSKEEDAEKRKNKKGEKAATKSLQ